MKSKNAFTLPELLVYIGVLSVFVTALYAVVILTIRHFRLSDARNDSTASNLQAVMRINGQLKNGANGSLQMQANPPAFLFLSAEPEGTQVYQVNADGQLLWQKWVCIHYDAQTMRLVKNTLPITPSPTIPTAPTFAAMFARPEQILARQISSMTLQQVDSRTLAYTLTTGVVPSISTKNVGNDARIGSTTSGLLTLRN